MSPDNQVVVTAGKRILVKHLKRRQQLHKLV
jgi:hypothetical protein